MKTKSIFIWVVIALIVSLTISTVVTAEEINFNDNNTKTNFTNASDAFNGSKVTAEFSKVKDLVRKLITSVASIGVIVAAVVMVFSKGKPQQYKNAKEALIFTIAGLMVIVFFDYVINIIIAARMG